jgi:hypothetical protein
MELTPKNADSDGSFRACPGFPGPESSGENLPIPKMGAEKFDR